jgi:hypothetical protein
VLLHDFRSRLLVGSDSEVYDVPILGEELRLYLTDEISSDADSLALIFVDHFLTPLRVEQLIEMQRRSSDGAGCGPQERCRIARCAKWTKRLAHFERVAESTKRIKQAHHPIISAADEGEELHGLETHENCSGCIEYASMRS